jgi:hypothetical protein
LASTGIALRWILQGKAEGLFLARFIAVTILLSAAVVSFGCTVWTSRSAISARVCYCLSRPCS